MHFSVARRDPGAPLFHLLTRIHSAARYPEPIALQASTHSLRSMPWRAREYNYTLVYTPHDLNGNS